MIIARHFNAGKSCNRIRPEGTVEPGAQGRPDRFNRDASKVRFPAVPSGLVRLALWSKAELGAICAFLWPSSIHGIVVHPAVSSVMCRLVA